MDLLFWLIFFICLFFGFFSALEDIYKRKVSNVLNLGFLSFCFLIFILNILTYTWIDFLILLIIILISYSLYHLEILGAADGKILIGICLLFLGYFSSLIFGFFLLNLILIYSFFISFFVLLKINKEAQISVFKGLNYQKMAFSLLLAFISVRSLFWFVKIPLTFLNIIYLFFGVFIFIFVIEFLIFQKQNTKIKKYLPLPNLVLFSLILFFWSGLILFLFLIYFMKIFIEYITILTEKVKINGDYYKSPFSVNLFVALLLTMILKEDLISFFLRLFS